MASCSRKVERVSGVASARPRRGLRAPAGAAASGWAVCWLSLQIFSLLGKVCSLRHPPGCCLSACPCGRSLQPFVRSERCGASGTGAGLAGRHCALLPLFCWFLCFCGARVKAVASALLLPAARSARHRLAPAPRRGRVLLCSAAARSAADQELRIVLGRARKKCWKTSVYNTGHFLGTARPPLPLPKAFVKL